MEYQRTYTEILHMAIELNKQKPTLIDFYVMLPTDLYLDCDSTSSLDHVFIFVLGNGFGE